MNKSAEDILQEAIDTLAQRGEQYDKDGEERSMPLVTELFNLLTKHNLTVKDGLVFVLILKLVRSYAGEDKLDNYIDFLGYAALAGENFSEEVWRKENNVDWMEKFGKELSEFYSCEISLHVQENSAGCITDVVIRFDGSSVRQAYPVETRYLYEPETIYELRKWINEAWVESQGGQ